MRRQLGLIRQRGIKTEYTEHRTTDYQTKTGSKRHILRCGLTEDKEHRRSKTARETRQGNKLINTETELNMYERHDRLSKEQGHRGSKNRTMNNTKSKNINKNKKKKHWVTDPRP